MGEGKEKVHTLLFSCWSSIWMSVSLALSSSLAACKAAKASGFSPLARLLELFLDMVRLGGGEGSPARRPSSQRSLGASRPRLRPTTFSYLPGRREITQALSERQRQAGNAVPTKSMARLRCLRQDLKIFHSKVIFCDHSLCCTIFPRIALYTGQPVNSQCTLLIEAAS